MVCNSETVNVRSGPSPEVRCRADVLNQEAVNQSVEKTTRMILAQFLHLYFGSLIISELNLLGFNSAQNQAHSKFDTRLNA